MVQNAIWTEKGIESERRNALARNIILEARTRRLEVRSTSYSYILLEVEARTT